MIRKSVSVLLAALMIFSLVPLGVFQASAAKTDSHAVAEPGNSYPALTLGSANIVSLSDGDNVFSFTPTETREYIFYSAGSSDTVATLFDDQYNYIADDDDSGEGYNFRMNTELTAGTTYYLYVSFYSGGEGSVELYVEEVPFAESLTINKGSFCTGYAGTALELNAVFSPENCVAETVSWTTQDSEYVSLDAGGSSVTVHLLKEGLATVTATSSRGLTSQINIMIISAETISLNETKDVNISNNGDKVRFSFTAPESRRYVFYATGGENTYEEYTTGSIFLGDSLIADNSDTNFRVIAMLEKDKTYFLEATIPDWGETCVGSFKATVEAVPYAAAVTITPGAEISGYAGSQVRLSAALTPDDAVENISWSSSNNTVASVSSYGMVYLNYPGTAYITATTENNVSSSVHVTVNDFETLTETSPVTAAVTTGDSKVMCKFTPPESGQYIFSFSASDYRIYADIGELYSDYTTYSLTYAESEPGKVFTVRADLSAGQSYYLSTGFSSYDVTGSYQVSVAKAVQASSISIAEGTALEGTLGNSISLSVNYTPANAATENITWTSSDESIVYLINNGVTMLTGVGSATVTATTESGLSASCVITVNGFDSISPGETKEVTISSPGETVSFEFVPDETASYTFFSSGECDTYGFLLTDEFEIIQSDDDSGGDSQFLITAEMAEGETYYLQSKCYGSGTGTFTVTLKKLVQATGIEITEGSTIVGHPGEQIRLHAAFLPDGAIEEPVIWSTSDDSIVSAYDDGYIILHKVGIANVTVISESGFTDSIIVTINDYDTIELDKEKSVTLSSDAENAIYKFVPSETCYYIYYSTGSEDTWGAILDSDMYQLTSGSYGGSDSNFRLRLRLTAGETYYLKARLNHGNSGSFGLCISKSPEELAAVIQTGETKPVNIESPGKKVMYRFTPATTGQYMFTTTETQRTQMCRLYDSNMTMLNSQGGYSSKITRELTAGSTYYFEGYFDDTSYTGSFSVTVERCVDAEELRFTNGDTLTGYINTTAEVFVEFLPENAAEEDIEWESSDTGIVDFDETFRRYAKLTFTGAGTAEVTATSDSGLTAVLTVTVKDYETLSSGETKTAVIENAGSSVVYKIIPSKTASYAIWSEGAGDTFATLYDSQMNKITDDDDSGVNTNFRVRQIFSAGTTYYLKAQYYGMGTGSFTVSMDEAPYVTALEILTEPTITTYYEGAVDDNMNYSGLTLRISWSDGVEINWKSTDSYTVRGEQIRMHRDGTDIAVICGDESDEYEIEILENPVDRIAFTGGAIELVENSGGEWSTDARGERYFHYYLSEIEAPEITVYYKDGTTAVTHLGEKLNGFYVSYLDNQRNTHFVLGSDNIITARYLGVEATAPVTVSDSPVAGIELVNPPDEHLIENYHGTWRTRRNPQTGEDEPFFLYNLYNLSQITVRINYKNGTSAEALYGDEVDGYYIEGRTTQYNEPWTVGSDNELIISYMNCETVLYITVDPNPVESVVLVSPSQNVLIENTDGSYWEYYDDDLGVYSEYFHYSLSRLDDALVQINFKNGESVTAHPNDYVNGYYVNTDSDQGEVHFTLGDNPYFISYLGVSAEAVATVAESPVSSIEVLDNYSVSLYENVDGYWMEQYDPVTGANVRIFIYTIPSIRDMNIRVHYKDGSTEIIHPNTAVNGYRVETSDNQRDVPWTIGANNAFTVSFMGAEAAVPAVIHPNPVDSIAVTKNTAKTLIENGDGYYLTSGGNRVFIYEPGTLSDAEIQINYADGTTKTAHIGDRLDGYRVSFTYDQYDDPWTVGSDNFVTVSYMGRNADMPVTVVPTPVESLTINRAPTRQYVYGDVYFGGTDYFSPDDLTGLRFTVNYKNGTTKTFTDSDIKNGNKIDGHNFFIECDENQTVGEMPVTFSYLGRSAVYNVTVAESSINKIEVVKLPTKPVYSLYYSPDYRGMKIKFTFANGRTGTLTLSDSNIIFGFNGNAGFYTGFEYNGVTGMILSAGQDDIRRFYISYAGLQCEITGLTFREDKTVTAVQVEDFSMSAENMLVNITNSDGSTESIRLTDIRDNRLGWVPEVYAVRALTDKGLLSFYIANPEYAYYMDYDLSIFGIQVTLGGSQAAKYIRGDVNGDGIVTIDDATRLQSYLAEFSVTNINLLQKCADANADGIIDIRDVTAIQRYLADMENPNGIGEAA